MLPPIEYIAWVSEVFQLRVAGLVKPFVDSQSLPVAHSLGFPEVLIESCHAKQSKIVFTNSFNASA